MHLLDAGRTIDRMEIADPELENYLGQQRAAAERSMAILKRVSKKDLDELTKKCGKDWSFLLERALERLTRYRDGKKVHKSWRRLLLYREQYGNVLWDRELNAVLDAVADLTSRLPPDDELCIEPDEKNRTIKFNGNPAKLAVLEYKLVNCIHEAGPSGITRRDLISNIYGKTVVQQQALDQLILRTRAKLKGIGLNMSSEELHWKLVALNSQPPKKKATVVSRNKKNTKRKSDSRKS